MKFLRSCKIFSLFLLLVFASIQVMQAFHIHKTTTNVAVDRLDNPSVDCELDVPGVNCSVCEYFLKTPPQILSESSVLLTYLPSKPTILNIDFSQSLYSTAVHCWTNKGPPQA